MAKQLCFLHQQCDASVRIVNNKGQTPLSIASSHFTGNDDEWIIQKILAKEIEQGRNTLNSPWINYRVAHSDGLEYGDLDPRFLVNRPIRETDRVTEYAVNPTTKQSRKGNFLRNNPNAVAAGGEKKDASVKPPKFKKRSTNQPENMPVLVQGEEQAWDRLMQGWTHHNLQKVDVMTYVQWKIRQRQSWIQETAEKLKQQQLDKKYMIEFIEAISLSKTQCSDMDKEAILLKRLILQLKHDPTSMLTTTASESSVKRHSKPVDFSNPAWKRACDHVQHLSMSTLEIDNTKYFHIPLTPIWIDTVEQIEHLTQKIHAESILAMDSEWYCDYNSNKTKRPSLLQIATTNNVWLIDLLRKNNDWEFHRKCRLLIRTLFHEKVLLGFAVGNDIPKLESYIRDQDDPQHSTLPRDMCLDLQWLFCHDADGHRCQNNTPGLACCVQQLSTKKFSKCEQCSNWSRRPLTKSQMDYAGLDAWILFFLLAEKSRARQQQSHTQGTTLNGS